MKNYLQLFYVELDDDLGNPQSADFGLSMEEGLGIKAVYESALPFPTWSVKGPIMIYFLMNKRTVAEIVKSTALALDPLNNTTIFTQETPRARDYSVSDAKWQFDDADKKSVSANEIARKRSTTPKQDFSGAPGLVDFITNLPAVAQAILQSRVSTRLYRRLIATQVLDIYNRVILKTLTISAASTQFAQIVANNLELFNSLK